MAEPTTEPIDKSAWGDGPWQTEPDRVEFEHAGLPCLLVRNPRSGNWCGYAAVPPGHPYHGMDYNIADVEVHGGLTYANACAGQICHVPKPGEPDDVYWFGFDCAHFMDLVPGYAHLFKGMPSLSADLRDTYRDVAYVTAETKRLAEQLAAKGAR